MVDSILQLGTGGILALLLVREVLTFLAKKKGDSGTTNYYSDARTEIMARQIAELHDWHDHEDNDGVKVWYVRRSLEESVAKLTDAIQTQNIILREMAGNNKELARAIREDRK